MKKKTIWIIVVVIILILVIGYFTNWFGMGKQKVSMTNGATTRFIGASLNCTQYDNFGNCVSYNV